MYFEFIAAVGRRPTRLRGTAQAHDPAVAPDLAARAALDEAAVHEVRGELKDRTFSPASFGWDAWDGRERCPVCREELTAGA
ncbi:hypothetical protein ACIP3B_26790 [Streptomyces anulatus]|uniref:hypothetical protein n=1 Tax=Streptomyces anulatus TaxID=1892 RepID=UPI0033DF9B35